MADFFEDIDKEFEDLNGWGESSDSSKGFDDSFFDTDGKNANAFPDSFDENDNFEDVQFEEEPHTGSFEFSNQSENISKTENELESPEESWKDKYATALWAIGAGIILIVVFAVIGRFISNGTKNKPPKTVYTQEVEEQTSVKETKAVVNVPTNNTTSSSGWLKITKPNLGEFKTIDGVFTVTNIEFLAKLSNTTNDKQIRALVTGSISGLSGVYELELPFSKAQNLDIGLSFKIVYGISKNENYYVYEIVEY